MINLNKTVNARIQILKIGRSFKIREKTSLFWYFRKTRESKSSIIPSELFIVEQHANNGQTIESRKQTLYPVNGSVFVEG